MIKQDMPKNERISKEIKRISAVYKNISPKQRAAIEGLIRRAAYMRITLEDMESDLDTGGFVEIFQQGKDNPPYERERPVAKLYNNINKNYQTIMKQLNEFVVKEPPKVKDDGFDSFVNSKE